MALVRFDPFKGFEKMGRRMTGLLDDIEKGFIVESGGFNPRVDIYEDEKFVHVHSEMPGLAKGDFKISVSDDHVLTITGEKKLLDEHKKRTFLTAERYFGSFTRSFVLPEYLDVDRIDAKYESGVLEISIPKIEPPKPREIEINVQ